MMCVGCQVVWFCCRENTTICLVLLQRKHEDHLFKWEDEAILDEIHMLQVQQRRLEDDVEKWKMMKTREDAPVGCVGTIGWLCGKLCDRED